jgi:hypothetical protein
MKHNIPITLHFKPFSVTLYQGTVTSQEKQ